MNQEIERLSELIASEPQNIELLLSRAKCYYKNGCKDLAYNDFASVLRIDSNNNEARVYTEMIKNIFNFGNREVINV